MAPAEPSRIMQRDLERNPRKLYDPDSRCLVAVGDESSSRGVKKKGDNEMTARQKEAWERHAAAQAELEKEQEEKRAEREQAKQERRERRLKYRQQRGPRTKGVLFVMDPRTGKVTEGCQLPMFTHSV